MSTPIDEGTANRIAKEIASAGQTFLYIRNQIHPAVRLEDRKNSHDYYVEWLTKTIMRISRKD